tara:strand:+ start:63 stop:926 length:864 start_codon:yes stop_codon:yes gene_type:complete
MVAQKINAIVLAGTSRREKRSIDEHDGLGRKNPTLVKLNGKPVIKNIVQALRGSEYINQDKIGIVGPEEELKQILKDDSIYYRQGKSFIENCVGTYDALSPNGEKTLFLPCDLPFIAPETITDFLKQCENHDARYYYGLINIKNIPKQIEPFKKTKKLHLRGRGYYRTANLNVFEGAGVEDRKTIEHYVRNAFEARRVKNIPAIGKLIWNAGKFIPDILKYFSPRGLKIRGLTNNEIETAIGKKLKLPFKLIETTDWRAAADIDYQEDFEFFKKNYEFLKQKADLVS